MILAGNEKKIALPEQKRDKSDSIIVNWNVI